MTKQEAIKELDSVGIDDVTIGDDSLLQFTANDSHGWADWDCYALLDGDEITHWGVVLQDENGNTDETRTFETLDALLSGLNECIPVEAL